MTTAGSMPLLTAGLSAMDRVVGRRLSILIFHRVTPAPDPLFPHEIDARRFDGLLAKICPSFNVLTIGEAHTLWREGRLPERALAITFDDGYADNEAVALPILRRHGAKATFFVSTGFLDGGRMWNDTIIELFRRSARTAVDLSDLGLGELPISSVEQRRAAIDRVLPVVKYSAPPEREAYVAKLGAICGAPSLPNDLMMRSEQVRRLHAEGMEIGAHTVTHPILTRVSDHDAQREIADGRSRLQDLIDQPVDVFAYPNGRPGRDFDPRHVEIVRRLGFRCAVSTSPGTVDRHSDDLQWERFTPWDQSPHRWMTRLLLTRYAPRRRRLGNLSTP